MTGDGLSLLEEVSFALAIIAMGITIWDRLRVPFWDRVSPLEVSFDPDFVVNPLPGAEVRFRLSIKNRVDYRARVLVGSAETWVRPAPESVDGPILSETLLDQIDLSAVGSTEDGHQLVADVEALQRRHLTLQVRLRQGQDGILSPGVTFLVGGRKRPRRNFSGRPKSVEVRWDGDRLTTREVARPTSLRR